MVKKFSKLDIETNKNEKEVDNIVYNSDSLKVVKYKNWDIVLEPNMVIILPYLRDEGYVLLRHEYIPTYQYFYKDVDNYKNITNFLTCISGSIEKGETLQNAIRRELYEETGIILSDMYNIEIDKNIFVSKGNCTQYHICMLELRYNDFRLVPPKGDGSTEENKSQTIKISLGDLDNIKTHDLITEYLITKFKLQYGLK